MKAPKPLLLLLMICAPLGALSESKRLTCSWLEQENGLHEGVVQKGSPASCMTQGANLGKSDDIEGRLAKANPPECPLGFNEVNKQFDTVSFASSKRTFFVVARYCTTGDGRITQTATHEQVYD